MLLLREHYPIQKLCEVLGVPRSSAYYEPRPDEDRPLLDALIEVAGRWPEGDPTGIQQAPRPESSAGMVLNKIATSCQKVQFLTYQQSSRTRVG